MGIDDEFRNLSLCDKHLSSQPHEQLLLDNAEESNPVVLSVEEPRTRPNAESPQMAYDASSASEMLQAASKSEQALSGPSRPGVEMRNEARGSSIRSA